MTARAFLRLLRTLAIFASFGYAYVSVIQGEWSRAGFFLLLGVLL